MDLVPDFSAGIAGLEFHRELLLHDLAVIRFKDGPDLLRKFFPKRAAEQFVAGAGKQRLSLRIHMRNLPFGIDREKAISRVLENIRGGARGLLQRGSRLITFLQLSNLTLSDGNAHVQKGKIERLT